MQGERRMHMSTAANTYTRGERNGFLIGMFGQNMIYNIVATGILLLPERHCAAGHGARLDLCAGPRLGRHQ